MNTVTALEAKTRLGKLLDRVASGEEIVITRHDKPVARMSLKGAVVGESAPGIAKYAGAPRGDGATQGIQASHRQRN